MLANLLIDSRRPSPFIDIAYAHQADDLIHQNPLVHQFGRLGKPIVEDPSTQRARVELIRHVSMLQNYIDARILSRNVSPNRDEGIINATKLLALLCKQKCMLLR